MKVIGQSTLANGSPYLHLGYVAAADLFYKSPLGISGHIVGISLILTSLVLIGQTVQRKLASRANKVMAGIGILTLIGGISLMVLNMRVVPDDERNVRSATSHAWYLAQQIHRLAVPKPPGPQTLADLQAADVRTTDLWQHPIRFSITHEDKGPKVTVVSAGIDGVFDNGDDVIVSWDGMYGDMRSNTSKTQASGAAITAAPATTAAAHN